MSLFTVEERIQGLFGASSGAADGVLHPVAVCSGPDKRLFVLKIRPDSPKSEADFFSLNLARARADAIVTSGRILREEPDVSHSLPEALASWRHEIQLKPLPPISVVLTSGRDLDLDHPVLGQGSALIFTSLEGASRLAAAAASREIELVGSDAPTLPGLIDFLRRDKRAQTISLEAGPSTVLPLYRTSSLHPSPIDELILSRYHGSVPDHLLGAPFLQEDELETLFTSCSNETEVPEPSGLWSFRRWLRG